MKTFPHRIGEEIELTYEKDEPFEYEFFPGQYLFELWGASGGGISPGYGSFVSGILPIKEKLTLYFYIGQKGVNGNSSSFNGGGKGCIYGSSGGGATDVRLVKGEWSEFNSLKSRIIVAAGGGGSQCNNKYLSKAGSGGILKGEDGNKLNLYQGDITIAFGGEQTKGGDHGKEYIGTAYEGTSGGFGIGGDGSIGDINGNGGSGGYFGGGGSATGSGVVGSGAGGSSYISGYKGCIAILENSTSKDWYFSEYSVHYSGFGFLSISAKSGTETMWDENGKIRIKCIQILNSHYSCKTVRMTSASFYFYIFCIIKWK